MRQGPERSQSAAEAQVKRWQRLGAPVQYLDRIKKVCPTLNEYLSNPPTEKEDKSSKLGQIGREFDKLAEKESLGLNSVHDETMMRLEARIGPMPPKSPAWSGWRDQTEAQVAWDEQYMLEEANLITERHDAVTEHEKKLKGFEEHLATEVSRAYPEDAAG